MRKLGLLLSIIGFLQVIFLNAQQNPLGYSIGVTIFGPNPSCPAAPLFIASVVPGAPAAIAGIHAGDQLHAVDGRTVKDLRDASARMASAGPGRVVLNLIRNGTDLTFSVTPERSVLIWSQQGLRKLDDGRVVPLDYSDSQIHDYRLMQSDLLRAMQAGDYLNVFPGHYPSNLALYYPGFELFVWHHGQKVIVGGIEDGPAKKRGIQWGDEIISVNGQDPRGKLLHQLELLFSSPHPATMHLSVDRFGVKKHFTFPLARASDVLRASGWRIFEGKKVPLWAPEQYAHCFE